MRSYTTQQHMHHVIALITVLKLVENCHFHIKLASERSIISSHNEICVCVLVGLDSCAAPSLREGSHPGI